MLVVFDVDGTLIRGERTDWDLFAVAIREVTGIEPTAAFWRGLEEVTSESILGEILKDRTRVVGAALTRQVATVFEGLLELAILKDEGLFAPRAGVAELMRALPVGGVALATGEWREPILKKLAASGLGVGSWPMATSSDRALRHEIIALAVERAGGDLADAVYVGDGLWDLRASRILGIPFIGTGEKARELAVAGARHVVEPMDTRRFLDTLETIRKGDLGYGARCDLGG